MKFIAQLAPIAAALLIMVQAAPTISNNNQRGCNHLNASQSRATCEEYCIKLGALTGECSGNDICECEYDSRKIKPTPSLNRRRQQQTEEEEGSVNDYNVYKNYDDYNNDNDSGEYNDYNYNDEQDEFEYTATKTANAYYNYETDIITITTRTIAVPTKAPEANTMFVKNPEPTEDSSHLIFHLNKEEQQKNVENAKDEKKNKKKYRASNDEDEEEQNVDWE